MDFTFVKLKSLSVFHMFEGINWPNVALLMSDWPEGTRGKLAITKAGKPKSREQLGYYYGHILPKAHESFRKSGEFTVTISSRGKVVNLPLSEKTVDIFLKDRYGHWKGEYKGKGDMNMAECAAFEDWSIMWLAKFYNCHILPADKDWNKKEKNEQKKIT